jgi:hypothetical protein
LRPGPLPPARSARSNPRLGNMANRQRLPQESSSGTLLA